MSSRRKRLRETEVVSPVSDRSKRAASNWDLRRRMYRTWQRRARNKGYNPWRVMTRIRKHPPKPRVSTKEHQKKSKTAGIALSGRLRLSYLLWAEFFREVMGYYPSISGTPELNPDNRETIRKVAEHNKCSVDRAYRLVWTVSAMKPNDDIVKEHGVMVRDPSVKEARKFERRLEFERWLEQPKGWTNLHRELGRARRHRIMLQATPGKLVAFSYERNILSFERWCHENGAPWTEVGMFLYNVHMPHTSTVLLMEHLIPGFRARNFLWISASFTYHYHRYVYMGDRRALAEYMADLDELQEKGGLIHGDHRITEET